MFIQLFDLLFVFWYIHYRASTLYNSICFWTKGLTDLRFKDLQTHRSYIKKTYRAKDYMSKRLTEPQITYQKDLQSYKSHVKMTYGATNHISSMVLYPKPLEQLSV